MGATASVREPYEYSFSNEVEGEDEQNNESRVNYNLSSYYGDESKIKAVRPTYLNVPCVKKHPFMQYRFDKKLGEGNVTVVYKGYTVSGEQQKVAIKEVLLSKLDSDEFADFKYEMNLMSQLDHINIVKLNSVYIPAPVSIHSDKIYQIQEYLKGGELLNNICKRKEYCETDIKRYIMQVTQALRYLHLRGVVHRNVRPENLILDLPSAQGTLKLVNFCFAECENTPRRKLKNPDISAYTAPELLNMNNVTLKYNNNNTTSHNLTAHTVWNNKTDMYSLGAILYLLLCGSTPSYEVSFNELFKTAAWRDISASAKDLVKNLLNRDPNYRYSTEDVLKHSWFNNDIVNRLSSGPSLLMSPSLRNTLDIANNTNSNNTPTKHGSFTFNLPGLNIYTANNNSESYTGVNSIPMPNNNNNDNMHTPSKISGSPTTVTHMNDSSDLPDQFHYTTFEEVNLSHVLELLREFILLRRWCNSARVSAGIVNFQKSDRYMKEKKVACLLSA